MMVVAMQGKPPRRILVALLGAVALVLFGASFLMRPAAVQAQTPAVQGPPAAAGQPIAVPGTCGVTIAHPRLNAAAAAIFTDAPTLGDVPGQSLRLRIVLQVIQGEDGTLQAQSSIGPLPLLSTGAAAQPDPALIERALTALEAGDLPVLTGPPWDEPPEITGLPMPDFQGIVVVELWDTATNAGVVSYGDAPADILNAAMPALRTIEHLGRPAGPPVEVRCPPA